MSRRATFLLAASWRIYDAVIGVVVWGALVPRSLLRVLVGRAPRHHLRERLGHTRVTPEASTRVIVHAVSAGEAVAAGAFIHALARQRPDWSVIVTCGNSDARTVALGLQDRMSTIAAVIAMPWDRRVALQRWLAGLAVRAVVVVEPEIWPNLYRACRTNSIPLFLVNGHVYGPDVRRYRAAQWFFADVLRVPAWIGVQTEQERDRFIAIGAPAERVQVAGHFKFDAPTRRDESATWRCINEARQSGCPLIVAGSTYATEERLLLRAFEQLRLRFPALRIILAPRHVTRAPALLSRVRARGHQAATGSSAGSSPWAVLVIDRLGELASLYRLADVAFVGGTLVNRGGHSVLEPARIGRATLVGPHVDNIQDLVTGLASVDGIMQMRDVAVDALCDALAGLLADSTARRRIGARARLYCAQHRGGARRSVDAIVQRICASAADASERGSVSERGQPLSPQATWPLDASEAKS